MKKRERGTGVKPQISVRDKGPFRLPLRFTRVHPFHHRFTVSHLPAQSLEPEF